MNRALMLALVPSTLGACSTGTGGADAGPARATLPLLVYSHCVWATGGPPASATLAIDVDGVPVARQDVSSLCDSPHGIGSTGIDGITGTPVLEGCLPPGATTVRITLCAPLARPFAVDLPVVARDQDAYLPACGPGTERVAYTPLKLDIPIEPDPAGADAGTPCAPADAALPAVERCWCVLGGGGQ